LSASLAQSPALPEDAAGGKAEREAENPFAAEEHTAGAKAQLSVNGLSGTSELVSFPKPSKPGSFSAVCPLPDTKQDSMESLLTQDAGVRPLVLGIEVFEREIKGFKHRGHRGTQGKSEA
jgi:hypothetical protein